MNRNFLRPLALASAALLGAAPLVAQQGARSITYQEAIAIALEQSSGVRIAANAVTSNEASVREDRMQFLPSLSVSTSGAQGYGASSGALGSQNAQALNAGVSSSLVLFDGNARQAQLRASQLGHEASEADLERARETAVFQVASGFTAVQDAQEQLRVRREDLAAREAEEAQIQALVDARSRPVSDLYQQQANVAAARARVVEADRAVEVAKTDLVQTLQLDPRGDYEFPVSGMAAVDAPTTRSLDSLVDRALANRADLEALEQEEAAAQQQVRVARASGLPQVSVGVGYNTSYNSGADAGLFDQLNESRGGSVSLSVSVPLFDKGRTTAATQRASVAADNARIAVETQRNAVAVEVRRAYLDREAAMAQLEATQAQLTAAQRALDASLERYRVGAAALLEVTQARAAQVEAASGVATARSNLLLQNTVIAYYVGDLAPPPE